MGRRGGLMAKNQFKICTMLWQENDWQVKSLKNDASRDTLREREGDSEIEIVQK